MMSSRAQLCQCSPTMVSTACDVNKKFNNAISVHMSMMYSIQQL
jgi:hypothetical protein